MYGLIRHANDMQIHRHNKSISVSILLLPELLEMIIIIKKLKYGTKYYFGLDVGVAELKLCQCYQIFIKTKNTIFVRFFGSIYSSILFLPTLVLNHYIVSR